MKKLFVFLFALLLGCGAFAQRFAWLTDVHYMRKQLGTSYLENMFREIDSLRLDFVAITGDVVDIGYTENFIELQKALKKLKTPVYLTYGNHEGKWSGSAGDKFKTYAGMDRFAIDYQGVKFVGFVSTMVLHNGSEIVPIQQYPWLDSVLNTVKPGQYVVAMTHYPMREDVRNADIVSEKFAKKNVQAFLVGHGHKDRYTEPFGIPNLMSDEVFSQPYNIVTVKPEGMDIYKKRLGQVDSFWIHLPFRARPYDASVFKKVSDDIFNARYPEVKVLWKKQLAYPVHSPAGYADGKVVFVDQSGILYACDAHSGQELWKQTMGGTCPASPKIAQGKVFLGSSSGVLKAFSLQDGKLLWEKDLGGEIWSNVGVDAQRVYVHTSKMEFHALDVLTGKPIWKTQNLKDASPSGRSIALEDVLVMMPLDKRVYGLHKMTGEFVWRTSLNGSRGCPMMEPLVGSKIPAAVFPTPGKLQSIELATGKIISGNEKSDNLNAICASEDGQTLYYRTKNGAIKAVPSDLSAKKAKWTVQLNIDEKDNGSAPLNLKDEVIYFSTASGYAGAVDVNTGTLKWRYKVGSAFVNTPTLVHLKAGKKAVVTTGNEGIITCLQLP